VQWSLHVFSCVTIAFWWGFSCVISSNICDCIGDNCVWLYGGQLFLSLAI
jgi:hypothetical protein